MNSDYLGSNIYNKYESKNPLVKEWIIFIIVGFATGLKVLRHYIVVGYVAPYLPSAFLTTVYGWNTNDN